MHRIGLVLVSALLAPASVAAEAQPATQASPAVIDGRQVAAAMKRLLGEHYVLPEVRGKFAAAIDRDQAAGRYAVGEAAVLAERLNETLSSVTADKHLTVMYDPETSEALAAATTPSGQGDTAPSEAERRAAEEKNHGLTQMKLLPGNIRYLEISGFEWAGPASERAYDTAMSFLAGGDAVIIDVRPNGGGSPEAVRYAVSHFIAPDKPLMTFFMGSRGEESTRSLATTKAPRMIGKPLYVLSSRGSASAAEEFLGHIAGYRLGEVIGERSAGAGFRNEYFALPGGLVISISVGRAVLASTGKDWEAVGISPTIETPADKALDVALVRALGRIAVSAPPARQAQLRAIAAAVEARTNPIKTELPLAAYAGVYGERTVRVTEEGLTIQRAQGPVSPLIAVAPNRFAYVNDPASTVTFAVGGGRSTALHLVRADGSQDHGKRTD